MAEAWALHDLGVVEGQVGNADGAERLIRQSLEIARDLGDYDLIVRCYVNLPAMVLDNAPDWDQMSEFIAEGLAMVRQASDIEAEGWLLWQQADVAEIRGQLELSAELRRLAIDVAERQGDRSTAAVRQVGLEWVEAHLGIWPDASRAADLEGEIEAEEQYLAWAIIWRALNLWRRDPKAAAAALLQRHPTPDKRNPFGDAVGRSTGVSGR